MNETIRVGDDTPWGKAEAVTQLGFGVHRVTTTSHGGIAMDDPAKEHVPDTVRATFTHGPNWAEEDFETPIALAFLLAAGAVPASQVPAARHMTADALTIAGMFNCYTAAIRPLEMLAPPRPRNDRDRRAPGTRHRPRERTRKMTNTMRVGDQTPWGFADFVKQLAPGVHLVGTPSHGGVAMDPAASNTVPEKVRATFTNGPLWAEEDCEASIALAFLIAAGTVPATSVSSPFTKIRGEALKIAAMYASYNAAIGPLGLLPPTPPSTAAEPQ